MLVSHGGYIKRVPLSTYRAQRRGGKGRSGMQTREEDFVARLFVATTHQPVLYFSSMGQVYKEKVWRLPLAAPQARGKALVNLLPLEAGRAHHHDHAAARGRGELGKSRRDVRDDARHGAAQQAVRFRAGQSRRQDRDAARRGRIDRRRADLLRQGRRAADDDARPVHPLLRRRSARLQGPRFHGRARHHARRGRRRHFAGDPARVRGDRRRARRLSQDAPRDGRRDRARRRRAEPEAEAAPAQRGGAFDGALRDNVGRRADHPHRFGKRLRQALVVLRISPDRARRQRHRRHGGQSRATASSSPPSRSSMATRSCW